MNPSNRRTACRLFPVLALALAPPSAHAAFPDKPITMYVSYAAGATTDLSARALATGAEKILRVPIAVENKAGGGGTVAAGLASRPFILKTAEDFIDHAKANPGMTFATAGAGGIPTGSQQMGVEALKRYREKPR